jgi:hypothetical protein
MGSWSACCRCRRAISLTINADQARQANTPAQLLRPRFTVARSISVQALIDGEPVGQATAPLIVPSTFLDPAREDGYPWGPNCS